MFEVCSLNMGSVAATQSSPVECLGMNMTSRVVILLGFMPTPLSTIEWRRGVEGTGTHSTERCWRLLIIGKSLRWSRGNALTLESILIWGRIRMINWMGTSHIIRVWRGVSPPR